MTPRAARFLSVLYVLGFAAAVTWPGMLLFNRLEPQILGLPFNMAWTAGWLVLGVLVLWMVDVVERRGGRS